MTVVPQGPTLLEADVEMEAAFDRVREAAGHRRSEPRLVSQAYAHLARLLEAQARPEEALIAWQTAAHYEPSESEASRLSSEAERLRPTTYQHGMVAEHQSGSRLAKRHVAYPSFVRIEATAVCNAACVFCPYPKIERQGARMSDALLDKLLSDLAEIPAGHKFGLSFHHMSEPFIDKRLPRLIARAADELPNAFIVINTNASPLTRARIEEISAAPNVAEVHVSFNDHRPTEYFQTMALPYDRTVANIDALHDAARCGALRIPVTIRRVGDGSHADHAFVDFCRTRWPLFRSTSKMAKDFLGQIDYGPAGAPIGSVARTETAVLGCAQWSQMTITVEGKLAVCCFDGMAEWVIGDVTKQHVLEVYNSDAVRRFRESVTRLEAPTPCNRCGIYWSGEKMNTAEYAPASA